MSHHYDQLVDNYGNLRFMKYLVRPILIKYYHRDRPNKIFHESQISIMCPSVAGIWVQSLGTANGTNCGRWLLFPSSIISLLREYQKYDTR